MSANYPNGNEPTTRMLTSDALVEIKLGGKHLIDEGAESLRKLDDLIRAKKGSPPAFKMILTAVGQFAYRRTDDGILVCPIGCLKP